MALRTIRTLGDEILTKKAKEVKTMTPHLREMIGDMFETMYETDGVGLAAPQIGVLKRIVVIDCGEPYVLINPVILQKDGVQTGSEGCLSVPGKLGVVTRAKHCKVRALNENMEEYIIDGEDLLARCLQHEIDHLDGIVFTEKVEGELMDVPADLEDEEA